METTQPLMRTECFDCEGQAELDLQVGTGRIEVRTSDSPHVRVEVSAEAGDPSRWDQRLEDLVIRFSDERRRLLVRTPRSFRRVEIALLVEAPAGSQLTASTQKGPITVDGFLSRLKTATGSGDVVAERIDGDVDVRVGSGTIRLGRVEGRLRSQSGSGEIEVASISGREAKLASGSGDMWASVSCTRTVHARTGSGNVAIAEAAEGQFDLMTGSGDVRVAVRPGVAAEIDLVLGLRTGPERARGSRSTTAERSVAYASERGHRIGATLSLTSAAG